MSVDTDEVAVGIDLGTTYCSVAICRLTKGGDSPKIVPNELGQKSTASYVYFQGEDVMVGAPAKKHAPLFPQSTIYDSKRILGRLIDDKDLISDSNKWAFQLFDRGDGVPVVYVPFQGARKRCSAVAISSILIREMKKIVESYVGRAVTRAVITVPANFTGAQRNATKEAALRCGLTVLRIMNEPTAAALAYFEKGVTSGNNKKLLVFDFGGGTVDITVLHSHNGAVNVLATCGNMHLGGEDIDERLVAYLAEQYRAEFGESDLMKSPRAVHRLRAAAEEAKRDLSASNSTVVVVDALHDGHDLRCTITRDKFESLCRDILQQTMPLVQKVVRDAKLTPSDISDVILAGGSTRIPLMQSMLSSFFNGKVPLCMTIPPEEVVAIGAALHARLIIRRQLNQPDPLHISLTETTPFTLGVMVEGGLVRPMITRSSAIPIETKCVFGTTADDQTQLSFRIFEGERPVVQGCSLVGKLTVNELRAQPRGDAKVEVTFSLDADGLLWVTATELEHGSRRGKVFTMDDPISGALLETEVEADHRLAEKDKQEVDRIQALLELKRYAYGTRHAVLYDQKANRLPTAERDRVLAASDRAIEWVAEHGQDSSRTESERMLANLKEQCASVVTERSDSAAPAAGNRSNSVTRAADQS